MKSSLGRIFSVILVTFAALLTTACAVHGQKETAASGDGDKLFAAPAVRVDRLVTKTAEVEGSIYELDAIQIGWKQPGGEWVMYFDEKQKKMVPAITRFHREKWSSPVGEKVLVTFVGGVLPAIVNGEYAKEIAKQASCKAGSICADNVNVNNNDLTAIATGGIGVGGSAAAGSSSQSGSTSSVNASGGACATCKLSP